MRVACNLRKGLLSGNSINLSPPSKTQSAQPQHLAQAIRTPPPAKGAAARPALRMGPWAFNPAATLRRLPGMAVAETQKQRPKPLGTLGASCSWQRCHCIESQHALCLRCTIAKICLQTNMKQLRCSKNTRLSSGGPPMHCFRATRFVSKVVCALGFLSMAPTQALNESGGRANQNMQLQFTFVQLDYDIFTNQSHTSEWLMQMRYQCCKTHLRCSCCKFGPAALSHLPHLRPQVSVGSSACTMDGCFWSQMAMTSESPAMFTKYKGMPFKTSSNTISTCCMPAVSTFTSRYRT